MNLLEFVDHTCLRPDASLKDITQLCQEAVSLGCASVCVPPTYVSSAHEMLRDKEPVVSTVIGFPFGYDTIPTKIMGIEQAIVACAKEIDLVLNVTYLVDEKWDLVRAELNDYTRACLSAKLKIIIEVGLVSRAQLAKACELCEEYRVDFIKTSTGYGPRPTEVEDITFIRMCAPNTSIKAAGGINDKDHAQSLFEAGASRLGMSKTVEVFKEDPVQLFKNGKPVDEAQA